MLWSYQYSGGQAKWSMWYEAIHKMKISEVSKNSKWNLNINEWIKDYEI